MSKFGWDQARPKIEGPTEWSYKCKSCDFLWTELRDLSFSVNTIHLKDSCVQCCGTEQSKLDFEKHQEELKIWRDESLSKLQTLLGKQNE